VKKPTSRCEISLPDFIFSQALIIFLQGDYVVLASEDICVCGCDVAAPYQLRCNADQPLADVLGSFTKQLTPDEWAVVRESPLESHVDTRFRQFWSLKEAFVKATGEGLGFDLGRCAFQLINENKQATVEIDGVPQPFWTFHLHELGQDHWVSVARAPITAIVDAWGGFKATLQLPNVPSDRHSEALLASEPPFTMLRVADLISPSRHVEYESAGGDLL
jgi:4'-phosphopantetheinyl transferase